MLCPKQRRPAETLLEVIAWREATVTGQQGLRAAASTSPSRAPAHSGGLYSLLPHKDISVAGRLGSPFHLSLLQHHTDGSRRPGRKWQSAPINGRSARARQPPAAGNTPQRGAGPGAANPNRSTALGTSRLSRTRMERSMFMLLVSDHARCRHLPFRFVSPLFCNPAVSQRGGGSCSRSKALRLNLLHGGLLVRYADAGLPTLQMGFSSRPTWLPRRRRVLDPILSLCSVCPTDG